MNFKKWKLGLFVATCLALFVAGASLSDPHTTWRGFVAVFSAGLLSHWGAYLMKHPTDAVDFNTNTFTQNPSTKNNINPTT